MNAPFFMPGTVTMHWQLSSNYFGMALSGVAMICFMTSEDALNREAALSRMSNFDQLGEQY